MRASTRVGDGGDQQRSGVEDQRPDTSGGIGHAPLGYLQRFPIDILKVDKSFLDGLGVDPDGIVLPEAIVGLARSLRLGTVAEGIEHAHQAEALQALGCRYGQGYHYARPVDAQRFEQLLMAQQRLVGLGTGPG